MKINGTSAECPVLFADNNNNYSDMTQGAMILISDS